MEGHGVTVSAAILCVHTHRAIETFSPTRNASNTWAIQHSVEHDTIFFFCRFHVKFDREISAWNWTHTEVQYIAIDHNVHLLSVSLPIVLYHLLFCVWSLYAPIIPYLWWYNTHLAFYVYLTYDVIIYIFYFMYIFNNKFMILTFLGAVYFYLLFCHNIHLVLCVCVDLWGHNILNIFCVYLYLYTLYPVWIVHLNLWCHNTHLIFCVWYYNIDLIFFYWSCHVFYWQSLAQLTFLPCYGNVIIVYLKLCNKISANIRPLML